MKKVIPPLVLGLVTLAVIFVLPVPKTTGIHESLLELIAKDYRLITAGIVVLFTSLAVIHATGTSRWNLLYFTQLVVGTLFLLLLCLPLFISPASPPAHAGEPMRQPRQ